MWLTCISDCSRSTRRAYARRPRRRSHPRIPDRADRCSISISRSRGGTIRNLTWKRWGRRCSTPMFSNTPRSEETFSAHYRPPGKGPRFHRRGAPAAFRRASGVDRSGEGRERRDHRTCRQNPARCHAASLKAAYNKAAGPASIPCATSIASSQRNCPNGGLRTPGNGEKAEPREPGLAVWGPINYATKFKLALANRPHPTRCSQTPRLALKQVRAVCLNLEAAA